MGAFSQNAIETGNYNNAFGESAQNHLTSGQWNDAHGIEAQGFATTAKNNVAMGRRAQHLLETGNFNTAIGAWAGFNTHDVSPEGRNAVRKSSYTTLIGGSAVLSVPDNDGGNDFATAVGFQTKVGEKSVAIGANATASGKDSIAIGYGVTADNEHQVVIGKIIDVVYLAGKKIVFNADGTVTWEQA